MQDERNPPRLFELAAAEIFRSLRLELLPRNRRTVPPVLFMHRKNPSTDQIEVSSFQLTGQPIDTWPRLIAVKVSQADAEWWAVSVELKLKVREEDLGEEDDDDIPDESNWLVIVVCSAIDRQVWWAHLERDEKGRLIEIGPEQPMPPSEARDEVLQTLGNRFYPLDA